MKLVSLQYLRAIAAVSVLLYHAGFYTNLQTGDGSILAIFGPIFGQFGVLIFFALSGYLMANQMTRMQGMPSRFFLHRVARIFPIFWFVCLLRAGVSAAIPDARQIDPLALALAPVGDRAYALGVEWTLVYEIGFYLCVLLIILLQLERWRYAIAAGWLLVVAGSAVLRGDYSPLTFDNLFALPFFANCAPFAAGLLLPGLPRGAFTRPGLLLGALLLLGLSQLPALAWCTVVLAGVGCACLVGFAATFGGNPRGLRWLARLGDWSFAIYLVHVPVLSVALGLAGTAGIVPLFCIEVAAILCVGSLVGLFDVFLYRHVKAACDALPPASRMAWCLGFFAMFFGSMTLANLHLLGADALPRDLQTLQRASSPGEVRTALAQAGYTEDGALRGNIDVFRRGQTGLLAVGWANDPDDPFNRTKVLVVVPGHGVSVLAPRNYRMDILRAIGDSRLVTPIGFQQNLPDSTCPVGAQRLTFIVAPDVRAYRPLGFNTCPPESRPHHARSDATETAEAR